MTAEQVLPRLLPDRPFLLIPVLCSLLLLQSPAFLCGQTTATADNRPSVTGVEGVTPATVGIVVLGETTSSGIPRYYTGTVIPRRSTETGFKRTGRIVTIEVEQGDRVRKGEVLAVLDTASLQANLKAVEAERRGAQAQLEELVAGPRSQTIAAAEASVEDLQAQSQQARSDHDRKLKLRDSGAISMQDFDNARLTLEAVEARLNAQRQVLEELRAGTRPEQIEAQRAVVAQLDAAIEGLTIELEESSLVAPFDAVVSRRMVDEGTIAAPGINLFRLVEVEAPEVWIGLPPDVVRSIGTGTVCPVEIGSDQRQARLTAVLPELDPATRTQTAVFTLETEAAEGITATSSELPAFGQTARLQLMQPVTQSGHWLPMHALARGERGLWSVMVAEPEQAGSEWATVRKEEVEIIQIDSERALVRGTLKNGDRAIISGTGKITLGQRVRVIESTH